MGVTIIYLGVMSKYTSRNIISGGPIVKDNNQKYITLLLKSFNSNKSKKTLFTEIRNLSNQLYENDAYQSASFRFEDHLNYLIDLTIPKDKLFSKIDRSKRKAIKKAEKLGVTFMEVDIKDQSKISAGYSIIQDVYRRAKLPLPKIDIFLSANNLSSTEGQLKMFTVSFKSEIIGVRFALIYKEIIFGWYAGSYSEFYKYSPNELLAWKTLEWGHNNGFKVFDYGGAGKPNIPYGVRSFKSKFGGSLVNYGRYKIIYKPLSMQIAQIVFKLKQKIY